jgi:hypothetical protein
MKTFKRIRYYPNRVPKNAPVLMRMMFKQPASIDEMPALKRALVRYPAQVYYYGPLTKDQVPYIRQQFKQMLHGQWMIFAYQVIPIAPEVAGNRWPHHDFRRWSAYETRKPYYYKLAQYRPDHYYWKRTV